MVLIMTVMGRPMKVIPVRDSPAVSMVKLVDVRSA
jgi:hypothetical protein